MGSVRSGGQWDEEKATAECVCWGGGLIRPQTVEYSWVKSKDGC